MIDPNKRVYVYFNLHKKVWSVRQSGKVVEHTKNIMLKDCRFLVSEAGRKRVLREKKKNVHAGVSGYVVDSIPEYKVYSEAKLTYNPYVHKGFVAVNDPYEIVEWADYVQMEYADVTPSVWACWTVNNMIGIKNG
jgi:hypothetical protein